MGLTDTLQQTTQRVAERDRRSLEYLASSSIRKEDYAKDIAQRDGVVSGLVCVLTAALPCITLTVGPNRQAKKREVLRDSHSRPLMTTCTVKGNQVCSRTFSQPNWGSMR